MKKIPRRMVIYPRDVENITGRRPSTARAILSRIKKLYHKKRGDFLTVPEFCEYMNMDEELVMSFLEM